MNMLNDPATGSDPAAALTDSFTASLALVSAAELGLVERMARGSVGLGDLARAELLGWMLVQSGIARRDGAGVSLAPWLARLGAPERAALIERARFTLMAAQDLIAGRRAFFSDPDGFFAQARTFGFFCYGRARETRLANLQDTEGWVNYVSAVNAHEAPVLAPMLDPGAARALLEIGGNAGGFALAMLAVNPALQAVVMDLPAVCAIGQRRVAGVPGAERLRFVPGDATQDPWPDVAGAAPDLIVFKSVLHDWDAASTDAMIARAHARLAPGGRVAVVERGRIEDAPATGDLALAANLVFAGYYRPPDFYEALLERCGFTRITRQSRDLDLAFHVVTGRKAA